MKRQCDLLNIFGPMMSLFTTRFFTLKNQEHFANNLYVSGSSYCSLYDRLQKAFFQIAANNDTAINNYAFLNVFPSTLLCDKRTVLILEKPAKCSFLLKIIFWL